MEILYKPTFIRHFNKLEELLQDEVLEKIELLKDKKNHKQLKVHKLTGKLKDFNSFSVNYTYRIVFFYENKKRVVFLAIGDHDVYK
ncbi:MAG: type II toxin-antitoxin system RelE/ParE family toxin [bacterium]